MKISRFFYNDSIYFGFVEGDLIFPIEDSSLLQELNSVCKEGLQTVIRPMPTSQVKWLPPTCPSKIVCVGRNYAAHASEMGNAVPSEPLLFLKPPSSMIAHEETIILPAQSSRVEHEGELAIVIRRKCKSLSSESEAKEYILGYTCLNDVTARDIQKMDIQFTRAKSFDTFCPIGPFIETNLDPSDLSIITKVNGEIKQQAKTSQMVFSVDFLVRYISHHMTLMPGDVIATGTPAGVSELRDRDICEIEIQGIGTLRNFVRKG
jgi:2-keto-4-pentenoate hydratase/2-oxohepta-3-ene-1,7-dioic acid hydratase in catechol pathway